MSDSTLNSEDIIRMLKIFRFNNACTGCVFLYGKDGFSCGDKLALACIDVLTEQGLQIDRLKANQPVRCKECVHWNNDRVHTTGMCRHKNVGKLKLDTDFCNYGERRTEE